jgi:hypothetical protein
MGYLIFLAVLVLAGAIYMTLRIVGVRVSFESMFKGLALLVWALSMIVMSTLLVLFFEVGIVLLVRMGLYVVGVDLSAISHRYQVIGLWTLVAVALCISAVNWFWYVLLIHREGK